ncbi:MAG: hypothetical protein AAFV78_13670 [Bacteroidota bacterium]
MKRVLLIISVVMIALVGCKQEGFVPTRCSIEEGRRGQCTYKVFENRSIEILPGDSLDMESFVRVNVGDKRVFEFDFTGNQDDLIADDEYGESIWFEVPMDLESFEYKDEELKDIQLTFRPSCFCLIETVSVDQGKVKGKKLGDKRWEIEIDITFTWSGITEERIFAAQFEQS